MCGISFSFINYKIKNQKIRKKIIKINKLISKKIFIRSLDELQTLRCNEVFVEIIKNDDSYIKRELNTIVKKIFSYKEKNKTDKTFDIIEDIIWTIEKEILSECTKIKNFLILEKIKLSKNSIIFVRYFLYILESLNYLETRGRDSASISINVISNKDPKINNSKNNNSHFINKFKKKISTNKYLFNLTVKYANSIGYAGENSEKLLNLIKKEKIFSDLNFDDFVFTNFIIHTRWASVGEVNLSNCHPLINFYKQNTSYFYMNGDITNYTNIKKELLNDKKFILNDNKSTNDLQILPSLLLHQKSAFNNKLDGSYVIFYHTTLNPDEILIYKKGVQGLYYTLDSDDNIHFASDVYGLINKSNIFKKAIENQNIVVNKNFAYNLKKDRKNFIRTNLLTRDLSKRGFSRYFLKEINDTEIFLKRTILNYIDTNKKSFKNLKHILKPKILEKLKNKKINKIIFTGMGSCHTASVVISDYLSKCLFSASINHIQVEATVASEGSGFHLSENMNDTIVVIIAQSGTTIDTNVFARLAKNRGAHTIALVNKKDGDVTFIVENNLYLGNGRDIEMSVPSTKTYTCHLVLGFIFSEQILSIYSKKIKKLFIETSKQLISANYINNLIKTLNLEINKIKFNILDYTNWVVVFDDSVNSLNAMELRIKLSECCYKAIPHMHFKNFEKMHLTKCLVFYVGSKIELFAKKHPSNYYILISSGKRNNELKNLKIVRLNSKNFISLNVETSLALQLLSYNMSEKIDKLSHSQNNNFSMKKLIKFLFNKEDLKYLNSLSEKKKNIYISEKLKRPIDSIIHQAKTVTVGALRQDKTKFDNLDMANQHEHVLNNVVNYYIDKDRIQSKYVIKLKKIDKVVFAGRFNSLKDNSNIIFSEDFTIEKNFVGTIIEYCNSSYRKNKFYNFRNSLNIKQGNLKKFSNIILTNKSSISNKKKSNIMEFNSKSAKSHNLIKTFLINNTVAQRNESIFFNAKRFMLENEHYYKLNLKEYFKKFANIKFLGSGINYLVARKFSNIYTKKFNKTVAFDIIENHKHIDISSESLLFIFASNIYRSGFQTDVYSEIEKFLAHDNVPIIYTNIGNNMFDQFSDARGNNLPKIIKLPLVNELYSLPIFEFYFENFIK